MQDDVQHNEDGGDGKTETTETTNLRGDQTKFLLFFPFFSIL